MKTNTKFSIALIIGALSVIAVFLLPTFSFAAENTDSKAVLIQSQSSVVTSDQDLTDEEDQEMIEIEESLVPLSKEIPVESAGNKVAHTWWLIPLAIILVAGITAYAHKE